MGGRGPRVSWLQGRGKSPVSSGPQGQAAFGHDLKGLVPWTLAAQAWTHCQGLVRVTGCGMPPGMGRKSQEGRLRSEKRQNSRIPPDAGQHLRGRKEGGELSSVAPLVAPLTRLQAGKAAGHSRVSLSPRGCD